ncbi:hypothetical protein LTS16_001759 [Friedmanniomyces endolithicus]|nr:hypothetical protein LTR35_006943 [Friedmanniomyces endolithicus]KAK0296108.1 hypothetical protein LTS00_005394 [Friedmanniomyces endolithicus]KAK0923679.1 hypothetical protein LTR57_006612 [Friedmanniomyces endolithicus]KAK0984069.1 hypothetical protein LTS01_010818 [Friedmanniomyces endolithicus]KAK1052691.1 hypothetical protein LTS16_001759 [Friedmanniomyces endolithicus]
MEDYVFDLAKPQIELVEPDYSRFEDWIPRLENSNTLESTNYVNKHAGTFLDTLHSVDENTSKEQGTFAGVTTLMSKEGYGSGTSTPVRADDGPGSTKRNGIRFPRHAVKILRDWLDSHVDHPYPTEEEKVELEQRTELQPSQVANWLANARRRKKVTDRPKAHMSPSLRPTTPALPIPGAAEKPWEELNPFERWQNSPPEHEPASITDIAHAVATTHPLGVSETASPSSASRHKRSSNGSGHCATSVTSLGTSAAHSSSKSASSAAFSQGSSQSFGSYGSFNSSLAGKRDRRRRRRPAPNASRKLTSDKKRVFQCTFCTDTFNSKYDWTRHEKSLHLSLEKWICAPLGPIIVDPLTNTKKCVYCDTQDPSDEHIENHSHRQCEDKGLDARTFYRKDHLRQHLRLMHGCEMTTFMELWKSTAVNINSRCGFCAQRFTVWQERIDHITAHFKAGVRMSEWKGCRGLDPAVAAQVTNAMPPYLIGIEAASVMPFSATDKGSWQQCMISHDEAHGKKITVTGEQVSDLPMCDTEHGSTCWEILTVRLGKYANEMAHAGVVLTDEMLQCQARVISFDSDDSWNQTPADNPEWLDLFKKAQGLNFIPSHIGGQGVQIPEDLETYGDLGLRIPFAVQLQAYKQIQTGSQTPPDDLSPEAYQEALTGRAHFRDSFARMHEEGRLHDEDFSCAHEECKLNIADISWLDGVEHGSSPRYRRWCSSELPLELLKPIAFSAGAGSGSQGACTAGNVAGLWKSLVDLGNRPPASSRDVDAMATAVGTTPALGRLVEAEQEPCTLPNCIGADPHGTKPKHCMSRYCHPGSQAAGRAQSLQARARLEAPLTDGMDQEAGTTHKFSFLPRHRLELSPEMSRHFATTTGAWVDSGTMPETRYTQFQAPTLANQDSISTGALMEFLGDGLGGCLPFSEDANTSDIPLSSNVGNIDWMDVEGVPLEDPAFMDDLDDLIAATTAPGDACGNAATTWDDDMLFASTPFGLSEGMVPELTEPVGDAMDFDFGDMTFDAAFDMPTDAGSLSCDPRQL